MDETFIKTLLDTALKEHEEKVRREIEELVRKHLEKTAEEWEDWKAELLLATRGY